jgi:hypothetical protein
MLRAVYFESESRLTRIEGWVFFGCRSLTSLEIPELVNAIEGSAFENSAITSLFVAEGNEDFIVDDFCLLGENEATLIRYLGSDAHLLIGSHIEVLCRSSFAYCTLLESISFDSESCLRRIEELAFASCFQLRSFVIPQSVEFLSGLAFDNSPIESIEIAPGNPYLSISGDFVVSSSGRHIVRYFGSASSLIVDSHFESIGDGCFAGCRSLTTIHFAFPSSISRIGFAAFRGLYCLSEIVIPGSVRDISAQCFGDMQRHVTIAFESQSTISLIRSIAGKSHVLEYLGAVTRSHAFPYDFQGDPTRGYAFIRDDRGWRAKEIDPHDLPINT